jgi:hypothetical protein
MQYLLRLFIRSGKAKAQPQAVVHGPQLHQLLALGRLPILFQGFVALLPEPLAAVVAKAAFQGLKPGAMKLAHAPVQKTAAFVCINLQRKTALAA